MLEMKNVTSLTRMAEVMKTAVAVPSQGLRNIDRAMSLWKICAASRFQRAGWSSVGAQDN